MIALHMVIGPLMKFSQSIIMIRKGAITKKTREE